MKHISVLSEAIEIKIEIENREFPYLIKTSDPEWKSKFFDDIFMFGEAFIEDNSNIFKHD